MDETCAFKSNGTRVDFSALTLKYHTPKFILFFSSLHSSVSTNKYLTGLLSELNEIKYLRIVPDGEEVPDK